MIKTEEFDASRYLTTSESQAELLNDALASGSTAYFAQAQEVIARARHGAHGAVQSAELK